MPTPSPRPFRATPPPVPFAARAWERVAPKYQILVSTVGDGELQARGIALNISGGGLCCYLYGPALAADAEVITRLSMHGRPDVFRVFARIAWKRPSLDAGAAHYGLSWLEGGDLEGVRQTIPALV